VKSLFDVSIQRFFLLIISLKIASSLISLVLTHSLDLLFWVFAIIIPIALIGIYVYIGIHRTDRTLTDEKFADTCYYMGFIFTISSIVISLFGLEEIQNNFEQIAFRFGAAMVSTLIGLVARVYLVSFKADSNSAVDYAEDALIRGSTAFVAKLGAASDQYAQFESRVTASTNLVEEHVRGRIEKLSEEYANHLQEHFYKQQQELSNLISETNRKMLEATVSMTSVVEPLKVRVTQATDELAGRLAKFQDDLGQKLSTIKFPDDYFAERLAKPVSNLSEELSKVTTQVCEVANEVKNSSAALGRAITSLNKKIEAGETNLTAIESVFLSSQQAVETAERNTAAIEQAQTLMEEIIKAIEITAQQGIASETGLKGVKTEITIAAESAKLLQEAMCQSLNLIKDAVEKTSANSNSLLNELPPLKSSIAEASVDLRKFAGELNSATQMIKDLDAEQREKSIYDTKTSSSV
jgi:ABC-type transporter Mla subunit MlaD